MMVGIFLGALGAALVKNAGREDEASKALAHAARREG
jgi:hypothetical protein